MTIEERGKRIAEIRKQKYEVCSLHFKHKMTQQQLADAAGLSRPYLSMVEAGLRDPRVEHLQRIAQALEVDISELL